MRLCKQKEKDLEEKVIEISTERLKGFKNHPFKVKNDQQMEALRESIERFGILNPIIVRSITEAGDHEKEMKSFFRRYGEMLQNSQLDIHELDEECHEMINESLDYALTYLFDWDYRINVPKLKKEVHRLMDLKCLCDLVSRARILTKYYAPNGVVLEELIYRRYCSNIVRTDVEVWQEMGFSRSVYYEKKKTALQYMGFFFFEIVIPQAVDNQKRVSELGWI